MLVSLNFIEKFITLPKISGTFDLEKICPILTRQGFEVEGAKIHGQGLEQVVVGRIDEVKQHPSADKLQVCQLNVGSNTLQQIVCGAPNARVGLYVAVALPGAKLPNGMEIKQALLRGVDSHGMLCSREELGLPVNVAVDGNGIWELDVDIQGGKSKEELSQKLGVSLFHALDLYDVLLEIAITPNRPDMLCHEGVARELEAGFQFAKIPFERKNPSFAIHSKVTEEIIRKDAMKNASVSCGDLKFVVENHIDAPTFFVTLETDQVEYSPAWLRNLLETLAQSSINRVVDVSNYVLLAYGQPNHPFDLDKISSQERTDKKLILRHAKPNESFLGLDGKERKLHEIDCVVSDEEKVHALLGVLGGEEAKVSLATHHIAVEFANPNPVKIRRTSRKHGRQTEASFMFEKGIDVAARFRAANEFVSLLNHLSDGKLKYSGSLHSQNLETFPIIQTEFQDRVIPFHSDDQKRILGTEIINFENQIEILESLSFKVTEKTENSAVVKVPTWRVNDVVASADLVEEFIRVVGIDNVPARPITASIVVNPDDAHFAFIEKANARAAALGYQEIIGLHFMRADDWEKLNLTSDVSLGTPVVVLNPIIGDEPLMHTTLIPDLLRKASRNLNFGIKNGQLFHSCRTFQKSDDEGSAVSSRDLTAGSIDLFDYSSQYGHTYCLENPPLIRPIETPRLAGVCFGNRVEKTWQNQSEISWTVHDIMAHVTGIANAVGASVQVQKLDEQHPMAPALHPGKRVGFYLQQNGNNLVSFGWCGELHPKVKRSYEITAPCFAFEINLSVLMRNVKSQQSINTKANAAQRFPSITRDFAFLFDDKITAKELNDVVSNSLQTLIASEIPANLLEVKIFDIYKGKGVESGEKSVAFKVTLEPIQKTFTDSDIQKISSQIAQDIGKNLNGELRSI